MEGVRPHSFVDGGVYGLSTRSNGRKDIETRKERDLISSRLALRIMLEGEYHRYRETMKNRVGNEIATQKKLEQGQRTITETVCSLESQIRSFEDAISYLETKNVELVAWLDEHEHSNEDGKGVDAEVAQVNMDDAIIPVDTLSRQLFNCVSEINAVEDVLFRLDKGLANNFTDLTAFLKIVRTLARKQFMAKALANKIQRYQQKVEMQNWRPQPTLNTQPPAYYPK